MKRKAPTEALEAVKVTKSTTVDSPGAARELTTTAPKRHACITLCLLVVLLLLCCPALLTLFGVLCGAGAGKRSRAQSSPSASQTTAWCRWVALPPLNVRRTCPQWCCQPVCGSLQDAVAKWEVARRRDVSASERAELVSQLLQQVGSPGLCCAARTQGCGAGLELRALLPAGARAHGRDFRLAHWLAHYPGLHKARQPGAAAGAAERAGACLCGAGKEPVRPLCGFQAGGHSHQGGAGGCACRPSSSRRLACLLAGGASVGPPGEAARDAETALSFQQRPGLPGHARADAQSLRLACAMLPGSAGRGWGACGAKLGRCETQGPPVSPCGHDLSDRKCGDTSDALRAPTLCRAALACPLSIPHPRVRALNLPPARAWAGLLRLVQGRAPQLLRHPCASAVVDELYNRASGAQRNMLAAEFFGREFALFTQVRAGWRAVRRAHQAMRCPSHMHARTAGQGAREPGSCAAGRGRAQAARDCPAAGHPPAADHGEGAAGRGALAQACPSAPGPTRCGSAPAAARPGRGSSGPEQPGALAAGCSRSTCRRRRARRWRRRWRRWPGRACCAWCTRATAPLWRAACWPLARPRTGRRPSRP